MKKVRLDKRVANPRQTVAKYEFEQAARAAEAWRLHAVEGLNQASIAKRMGISQFTVSKDMERAREFLPEQYKARAVTYFEESVARLDYLLKSLALRLEQSTDPYLNLKAIDRDIEAGIVKAFLFDPYLNDGITDVAALKRDIASGVNLGPLTKYIEFGRLDLAAVKEYRAVDESMRKLLGTDRNKDKIEISGADGGAIKLSAVAESIAQLAQARKKSRTIEVEAREAQ